MKPNLQDDALQNHRLDPKNPRNYFQHELIISDQISREGLEVVWRELEYILNADVEGDIVEFGCYAGTTSVFIRRLLDKYRRGGERAFHVYDSFAGLPAKSSQDANAAGVDFSAGKLAVSKKDFLQTFRAAGLTPPVVHKGWFNELTPGDVPEKIAFAFLDGDFYDSILSSLKLVYPRLENGGIILIDDYQRETLPGVERAIRDFFRGRDLKHLQVQANIAIIKL